MLTERRAKIARATAAKDWRENKEARVIRNPQLEAAYAAVYGRLYELQETITGLTYV